MRECEEFLIIKLLIDCLYIIIFYIFLIIYMVSCFFFVLVNLSEWKRWVVKLV